MPHAAICSFRDSSVRRRRERRAPILAWSSERGDWRASRRPPRWNGSRAAGGLQAETQRRASADRTAYRYRRWCPTLPTTGPAMKCPDCTCRPAQDGFTVPPPRSARLEHGSRALCFGFASARGCLWRAGSSRAAARGSALLRGRTIPSYRPSLRHEFLCEHRADGRIGAPVDLVVATRPRWPPSRDRVVRACA